MRREVVSRETFHGVLSLLRKELHLAVDTETTGLYPYKDDTLFSIIIAGAPGVFYFNFERYEGLDDNFVLHEPAYWAELREFFKKERIWFFQNAKFDLAFLLKEGITIGGMIHDTKTTARLIDNDRMSYSLKELAREYVGKEKSEAVEEYIKEHKLFSMVDVPHKTNRERRARFHEVPFEIISEYGLQDGTITYDLGMWQIDKIEQICQNTFLRRRAHSRDLGMVYSNECALIQPIFSMEKLGVKIDEKYCTDAIAHEECEQSKAAHNFLKLTGKDFMDSPKLFREVLKDAVHKKTPKGAPSYDKNSLADIRDNPIAQNILAYREAKNQANFFHGFLHHAKEGTLHTTFLADGTASGRFSSANPNLQNLTKPESGEGGSGGFEVRGAIVPREGFDFFIFDYQAQEYRLLLDQAGATTLIDKVKSGLDVHQATADLAGVTRQQAKMANFATLYGAGDKKLAASLKISETEAKRIKKAIFDAAPEIKDFIKFTINQAEDYGEVTNWRGRISRFRPRDAYRAPNYVIQGGCADITKQAIVDIFWFLKPWRSRMVLTVHDSIILEIAHGEEALIPEIKKLMISAYPEKTLPMEVTIERATKNLAETEDYVGY